MRGMAWVLEVTEGMEIVCIKQMIDHLGYFWFALVLTLRMKPGCDGQRTTVKFGSWYTSVCSVSLGGLAL